VFPCVRGICAVDLGDTTSAPRRTPRRAASTSAERAVTVPVGWRELDQRGVERDAPALEEAGDVRQEHGHEVGAALGDHGLAHRGAGEERHGEEAPGVLGLREGRRAFGVQVVERHAFEVGAPASASTSGVGVAEPPCTKTFIAAGTGRALLEATIAELERRGAPARRALDRGAERGGAAALRPAPASDRRWWS
jgi:hypothetical protein